MKIVELMLLFLMLVALLIGSYVIWMNLPMANKTYAPFSANPSSPAEVSASGSIMQFYPDMRYRDRNISYRLESTCTETKWKNIEKAFSILSDRTALSFYHSRDNPEIRVMCSEVSPMAEEKGHFIAGEGGPSEIINTTEFSVILNGKISLYRDERCDEPKIAIHEILHALGFDHYNNSESILYPITGCNQEIDGEIIEDINRLYSFDSLPDLVIEYITANKTGRYLNFDINVSNSGLADSSGAQLLVYSGGEKVTNFTLGEMEIGMRRMLYVQNVRLPFSSDEVTFVVESDDSGELNTQNNQVEMRAL
jgi:hypothetical protein